MKNGKHYLLVMWGDVEPGLMGPFASEKARDRKAREIRKVNGDDDGLYPLEATGKVAVGSYSGAFFEGGRKS